MINVFDFAFGSLGNYALVALAFATVLAAMTGYFWDEWGDGSDDDGFLLLIPTLGAIVWPAAPVWMSGWLAYRISKRRRVAKVPAAHTVDRGEDKPDNG